MIDTHQHLIEPGRFSYPWMDQMPKHAGVYDLKRYRTESASTPITASIVMESDVAVADQVAEANHYCEVACEPESMVMGVIAACRPEEPGFVEQLELMTCPKLVGVRRVLHVVDDGTSVSLNFRENMARLADYNLCFDLCVRDDQLPLALDLVRATPHTRFILDHCGNPPLQDESALATWRDNIARLATLHNVSCKFSGLVNHLKENQTILDSCQPILEHVVRHFGWERLMFGGDWPVCLFAGSLLEDWTEGTEAMLASYPDETSNAFFVGNATRIYGLH